MPALPACLPPSIASPRQLAGRLRAGLRRLAWLGLLAGSLAQAQAVQPAGEAASAAIAASAPAAAAPRLAPVERGLLWRVQAADGQGAPSFLYGTLHIDDRRLIERLDQVAPLREALAGARLLMLELLPSADDARAFQQATQLPEGESLQALTGPALGQTVIGLLRDRYGIPPEVAGRFKPWAAYLFLNQPARAIGEILDRAILNRALRERRPVAALETLAQQLDALDGLPLPQQLKLLESVALRHDRTQAAIEGLIQLYLDEDLNGLADLQQPGPRDDAALAAAHAALVERLVHQRNLGMLRSLAPELKAGGVFVAVGALHLWGDRGLPALLAAEGWSVQRVR